ncbi:MAG: peptide deformylase [candidate division WOR-3 bacterium]
MLSSKVKKNEQLDIIKYPNQVLREKAKPVEKITHEIFELAEGMIKTMLKNNGVGLAANQVGALWRLFVVNLKPFEDTPEPAVIINPKILKKEGVIEEEEGCLSFPGLYLHIPRAKKLLLHYQNLFNERVVMEAEGFLARAIQHESDHLDGILFIDYTKEEEQAKVKQYLQSLSQL